MEKVIVHRLYVRNPENGWSEHFDFIHREKADKQAKLYSEAGCVCGVSEIMINDDHLVPWSVTPLKA